MKPKVSIIIPAYNTSKYIARAIESALNQTEQNIEVLVVDDASTDNTAEVVNNFTDSRLQLLVNESNKGPSYSRNLAIKEAKGEWIALLDSDDWYTPQRIETLLHVAQEENADLIADNIYFIADGADSPTSTMFFQQGIRFEKPKVIDSVYFVDYYLSVTKPLIKLNFLLQHSLEFNEDLRYEEDFVLFLLCLLKGARFIIVPESYYYYCNRSGSLVTEYMHFHEQAYKTNLYLLQQYFIKENSKLTHSLSKRLIIMKQIRAFYRVRQSVKDGAFFNALIEAIQNPVFFLALWQRLPAILKYQVIQRFQTKLS
jgi:succinoglycan biosynthesis protein ExoO